MSDDSGCIADPADRFTHLSTRDSAEAESSSDAAATSAADLSRPLKITIHQHVPFSAVWASALQIRLTCTWQCCWTFSVTFRGAVAACGKRNFRCGRAGPRATTRSFRLMQKTFTSRSRHCTTCFEIVAICCYLTLFLTLVI